MRRVYVLNVDPRTSQVTSVLSAESARNIHGTTWLLRNAEFLGPGATLTMIDGKELELQETAADVGFLAAEPEELSFKELLKQIQMLKAKGSSDMNKIRDKEAKLWNKIWLPIASLIFGWVGAALGFQPQRSVSRSKAMGAGVLIIFVYYAVFNFLIILAEQGHFTPFWVGLLPLLAGAFTSAYLVKKTTT